MDVFKLQASLGLNTEEYERALKAAVSQAESLTKNMQQLTTASNSTDTSITETGKAAEDESKSVKEAAEQTKKLSDSLEETGKNSDDAANKLKEASGKLKGDLAAAAKAGGAAFAATSAVIIKSTKDAVDNFAQYEQLVGGAQLMFGDAYEDIAKKADNAYKTVQMSQIEYLEQVNGFATGLKTALGGNAEVAADLADKILTAEADVIAATGNSKEAVQNAFNGIMRSNYTMLDNLQLGIKPTKDGFQEVIDKVNEWNAANGKATKYQIDNLADAQNALVDYIEMQGLAGYASKEAADTIEGSAASAKAAWQNLLTGFGRDDADIDKLVDDVSESVKALGKNVIPVAERAFVSLSKTAMKEAVSLSKRIPDLADHAAEHIHKTIANEFGASADSIFAVEGAVKSAAAAFVTYKAAMVVSDAVEGVVALTNVIKGATTAQEALNAAGLANPYVLIATAVAGATVALKSYLDTQIDLIDVAGDTYNNLTDEQQAFIDSSNELAASINNDIKAAKGNIESVNAEVGALQNMTDELYKINDAEELTNDQKAKMKTLVDSLNSSLPDLNLQLDRETGHLKNQREEVDALIESYSKQAKAQAAQESMVQLYKDQFEAEKKLKQSEKERADARQKYDQLLWKSYQIESEYNRLKEAAEDTTRGLSVEEQKRYEELGHQLHDVNEQIREQKNSVGDLDGAFVTANESLNSVNDSLKDCETIQADLAEDTKLLADSTEESTSKMKEGMIAHQKVTKALASDLKDYIVYVGGETYNISQDTYDELQRLNEEYSQALQEQEQNIRGSLDLFSEFSGGAETSSQELINNLWNNATELENWADNLASLADKGINEGLLNELEAAGPSSANKVKAMTQMSDTELKNYSDKWAETQKRIHEIAEDQTEDVKRNAEVSMANLIGVADDNKDKAKEAYADLGRYMTDGAGGAIVDGTSNYVVPVTGDMINRMATEANNKLTEADMAGKGENIPAGLAKGIENGEHWAIEAMHKMIDDVEKTYMEDTQSSSPSKLFKKLAEYIPQGMAQGIKNGKDAVVNAMGDVVSAVEDSLVVLNPPKGKGLISLEPSNDSNFRIKSNDEDSLFTVITPDNDESERSSSRRNYGSHNNNGSGTNRTLTINLVLQNGEPFARFVAPYLDLINAESVTLQARGAAI